MLGPVLRRRALQQRSTLRYIVPSSLARWYASYPPHTVVKMPALSPTMTAGNIGAWQKKPGDTIAPGEVLVEIETDKAQMDFEFQEEGVLAKVLKETGEKDVAVGNVRWPLLSPPPLPKMEKSFPHPFWFCVRRHADCGCTTSPLLSWSKKAPTSRPSRASR